MRLRLWVILVSLLVASSASAQGFVCDGSTDDTIALQAAVDAAWATPTHTGTVSLPAGHCLISDTITVGHYQTAYNHIHLVGAGLDSTQIVYAGPTERPALLLNHEAYFHWADFSVVNLGARGTSKGIAVSATDGGGTQSTGGTFSRIGIAGFSVNWWFGHDDALGLPGDASEMTLRECQSHRADHGWLANGYNSLNFWLYDFQANGNTEAISVGVASGGPSDGPKVIGAAFSGNTHDIYGGNAFGLTVIENVRTESSEFLGGQLGRVVVKHAVTTCPTCVAIAVSNLEELTLESVDLVGSMQIHGAFGTLDISNSTIASATMEWPFTFTPGSDRDMLFVRLHHNYWRNPASQGDVRLTVDREAYLSEPPSSPTPSNAAVSSVNGLLDDVLGHITPGLGLERVRGLAFGSNVQGRNVRDRVTFVHSGWAMFAWQRSLTVSTTGGSNAIVATAGTFDVHGADIGKRVLIPLGSDSCWSHGGTNPGPFTGWIASVLDTTHATVYGRPYVYAVDQCTPALRTATGLQAILGENEPDAQWMATGLACDRNEKVWIDWTTVTTAGATFRSSNTASTATCYFQAWR